jgi:F-type H+-transporting ATPase subunit b
MFVTPGYAQEHAPAEGEAPATGEAHTEAEAGHESGAFPPFDSSSFPSQLLWLAITFGLFYLFLQRTILPRIGNIIEVRSNRIAGDLDQAARLKGEADAAVADYEQELAEAKAKANAIGQQARDAGKAEAEAERKKIEASLGKKLAEAEARIAAIKSRAMGEVGTIAEETSAAIIQQLTGGKVDRASLAAAVKSVRG